MIYFIADTHFGHDREFIYKPRGFNSVEEMNETIIENWNRVVKPDDTVYHLGDFFCTDDIMYISNIVQRLTGTVILIRGNHDTTRRVEHCTLFREGVLKRVLSCRVITCMYADMINVGFNGNEKKFYLSHYPALTADLTSNPKTCIYNIHGHLHTKNKFYEDRPYMYNVSCDAQNNTPVSIKQVFEDIDNEIEKCMEYV